MGKPIDFLQTILKATSINDDIVRYCVIGRSASLAGWLTLDAFQWVRISINHLPLNQSF